MKTTNVAADFRLARMRGVPLLAVTTPDPQATIGRLAAALNGEASRTPMVHWSIVSGFTAAKIVDPTTRQANVNEPGRQALSVLSDMPDMLTNPPEAMSKAAALPKGSILFAETLDACFAESGVSGVASAQAVRALRDTFKAAGSQLVVLCPSIQLPPLLKDDMLVLNEDLPDREELAGIVTTIHRAAKLDVPEADDMARAVDAIAGLAAFPAEQATAISLRREGLDVPALWARKRQMIEQTPGLSVRNDATRFADIGGCENVKGFLRRLIEGKRRPRVVLFIDEIEKALGAAGSDSSGVSQDFLGTLLQWMQERLSSNTLAGMIFVGPPGAAKSAVATAVGQEAGAPTIQMDLGGTKSKWVGESEAQIRRGLQVVDAVGQGMVLAVATCNSFGSLPPELRRRFAFGTFFFDLPSPEERAAIWGIYRAKFGVSPEDELPDDEGWTGAEVRQCCLLADTTGMSLREASSYIVPVARAAKDQIEALRNQAEGRFISASFPGVYTRRSGAAAGPARALVLE